LVAQFSAAHDIVWLLAQFSLREVYRPSKRATTPSCRTKYVNKILTKADVTTFCTNSRSQERA